MTESHVTLQAKDPWAIADVLLKQHVSFLVS